MKIIQKQTVCQIVDELYQKLKQANIKPKMIIVTEKDNNNFVCSLVYVFNYSGEVYILKYKDFFTAEYEGEEIKDLFKKVDRIHQFLKDHLLKPCHLNQYSNYLRLRL